MKKLLAMFMVASIFSLVACGPSEEEQAAAEAEAEAMVNEMFDGLEEEMEEATEEVATEEEAPAEEAPAEEATEGGDSEEEAAE